MTIILRFADDVARQAFALEVAYEAHRNDAFSLDTLERLRDGQTQFTGPEVQGLYDLARVSLGVDYTVVD